MKRIRAIQMVIKKGEVVAIAGLLYFGIQGFFGDVSETLALLSV